LGDCERLRRLSFFFSVCGEALVEGGLVGGSLVSVGPLVSSSFFFSAEEEEDDEERDRDRDLDPLLLEVFFFLSLSDPAEGLSLDDERDDLDLLLPVVLRRLRGVVGFFPGIMDFCFLAFSVSLADVFLGLLLLVVLLWLLLPLPPLLALRLLCLVDFSFLGAEAVDDVVDDERDLDFVLDLDLDRERFDADVLLPFLLFLEADGDRDLDREDRLLERERLDERDDDLLLFGLDDFLGFVGGFLLFDLLPASE
jgi:hypothetical protein